jgi:hypothetical protein
LECKTIGSVNKIFSIDCLKFKKPVLLIEVRRNDC